MHAVACPICEAAKAYLMRLLEISEPEAHRRLQKTAMDRRMRKADLAAQFLAGAETEAVTELVTILRLSHDPQLRCASQ